MLQDLKLRVDEVNADLEGPWSGAVRDIYADAFEFGENIPGVVAHFSVELEKAARLLHSHKVEDRQNGFYRASVVGGALRVLVGGLNQWNFEGGEKAEAEN